jgi:hypothetical protein
LTSGTRRPASGRCRVVGHFIAPHAPEFPARFARVSSALRSPAVEPVSRAVAMRCDRYAMPGATPACAVFRRWNTPKKTLRRSNLQSLDALHVLFLTRDWHKRCSR